MKTKINQFLTPTVAAASLLFLGACEDDKDEVNNADLLIGEWNYISADGDLYDGGTGDYSYNLVFTFEADGDLSVCGETLDKNTKAVIELESGDDCYEGDWAWVSKGEEVNFGWSDTYTDEETGAITTYEVNIDMTITKLTASELEGTWEGEDDGVKYEYEVVFKKR